MRVVGITLLALFAQAHAEEAAANNTAATDDDDLNALLSNMDDEMMDKVADKLIDKLLGHALGAFNLSEADLTNTELFKLPNMATDTEGDATGRQPTEEELQQIEKAAAAEATAAAALAAAAAETAAALAATFHEAYNNPDAYNQDLGNPDLSRYLPEDFAHEGLAPHAEDVCEGRDFNEQECQAQGSGCCFWENNACWAAIDGACEAPASENTELVDEDSQDEAPDLATVVMVGLASVVTGSAVTFALFRPRGKITESQLPLLTPS